MATTEEKQETIDTLKGPRYYRIRLHGYGGESVYISISERAHDFWQAHTEKYGNSDLVEYMINAQDEECEFEEIQDVPSEAAFLTDLDGDISAWYESHTEFEHTYGVDLASAYLTVEEVTDNESQVITEIVQGKELQEFLNEIEEANDYDFELIEMDSCDEHQEVKYIAQLYSSEKGTFFDALIETVGKFDPKKLKVCTTEYLNGEDTVTEIYYDGVELDNDGGDTRGKGYSAAVWAN